MFLRFKFCIHQRACVLNFLLKNQIRCTLVHTATILEEEIVLYMQIDYEDQRVTFPEWTALKPTTPLGQLPILYWDGLEIPQSGTITR
jgi:hypothetical protein